MSRRILAVAAVLLTGVLFKAAGPAVLAVWVLSAIGILLMKDRVLPYVLACLTAIDPSARLIVTTNLLIGTGLALGPAAAALTLYPAPDFSGVVALGVTGAALSFALILRLAWDVLRAG